MSSADEGDPRVRDVRRRPSGHPAGRAAAVMIGVVVLIVVLSAAPLLFG